MRILSLLLHITSCPLERLYKQCIKRAHFPVYLPGADITFFEKPAHLLFV